MQEEKELGRELARAHADMGKILLRTGLRVILAGVIVLAGIRGNPPGRGPVSFLAGALVALIILAAAAWVFWPLTHRRDFAAFYENGIVIGPRKWMLKELGEISFQDVKSNHSLFIRTYLCTSVRKFDITYIKDCKKNFNRAYSDVI